MIWKYYVQAAVACIVSISTLSYAVSPLLPDFQTSIQSQKPLEDPGCDGSGIVDPDGRCNGDGVIDNPPDRNREGFRFDNPSTNCKYVTQMYIYDVFKVLEKDMGKLFTYIHKDVDFHVMGHHPVAGHYHDLLHFYVNALRRVSVCFSDHAEKFEVHPQAIHGGCNSPWSVSEIMFRGLLNTGDTFEVVNVWVTKWYKGQIVEARTYIDQGSVTDALRRNEMWTNGTSYRENRQYMPGPSGMPDLEQKRSRIACTSCQSRKRKCSGDQPCTTCAQFGADCRYDFLSRKKKDIRHFQSQSMASSLLSPATVQNDIAAKRQQQDHQTNPAALAGLLLKALEANSGAAFARRLNPKNDVAGAPKLHLFGWNVGARYPTPGWTQALASVKPRSVVEIISQDEMRALAGTFFDKVDPCYPFIDRDILLRQVSRRWLPSSAEALGYGPYDAVLCGVAAFGYLFSRRQATTIELQLVESARSILEQGLQSEPLSPLETVTGWVLRVAYLRMTTTAHAAWMASCSLMHLIEATGMHIEPSSNTALDRTSTSEPYNPETRRRLFAMARHLNVWISFELGRSRVVLQGATSFPPSPRALQTVPTTNGFEAATDIFNLLPVSESLDPNEAQDVSTLETALSDVLSITYTNPPLILVQCNLTLCIYRRLRALSSTISGDLLDRVLGLSTKGLTAVSELVKVNSPWHQVANVPFQVIVTLLAIDNRSSLAMLRNAMRVLHEVAEAYDTEVMREAYTTAYLMIVMHQRRKEEDIRMLKDVLQFNPSISPSMPQNATPTETQTETQIRESAVQSDHTLMDYPGFSWLSDILVDIPSLRDFDMDPL
ncbi:uncharacterized protein BDV17DRAFT_281762 [Aspergillus undulatus]|uniref:uncharacterized protein n=1 Tax=Aspergillus undulatus TaxID=1810928 RepID=UPI003CCDA35A